jgi:hypothetical protein
MEAETKTKSFEEEAKDLSGHVTDFIETYFELITVKIAQKSINFTASVINISILALFGFLVIFFLSLGLAWWLGTLLNNRAAGFFIVGGIYLLCIILFILMKKNTVLPFLRNLLTRMIYE